MANEDDIPNEPGSPDEEIPFEDFEGGGSTLGDLLRNNPMVKVGVVLGGFAAIIGGVILFGGNEQPLTSAVQQASDVNEPPATSDVSPAYRIAQDDKNKQELEEAIKNQDSHIPVPVSPVKGGLGDIKEDKPEAEDPLARWRRIQEERVKRDQAPPQTVPMGQAAAPGGVDSSAKAIQELSQAMATQMESILQGIKPVKPEQKSITTEKWLEDRAKKAAELTTKTGGTPSGDAGAKEEEKIVEIIIPAGTIEYGQMLLEANSDVKGPIMAQLVSGPLTGSRMLGTFQVQEEYLVLTFKTIVIDGVSHGIDAIAINPGDANIGMVTDVDHRYFSRVILPAAAAFVEGMGSAIAQTGSSTTTGAGGTTATSTEPDAEQELFKGIEKAAEKVSDVIDKQGDVKPLIRVAAGTPMGVLFMAPVTEESQ